MPSSFPTSRRLTRATGALLLVAAPLLGACGGGGPGEGEPVRVVVPQGASFRAAAESLAAADVVNSPMLFRLYAKLRGRDRALKPGTYEFRRGAAWDSLLAGLVSGEGVVATIAVPEGWELARIGALLTERLEVPADSVQAAVRDSALRARLDVPTPTLEGYLFPATYRFPLGTTAREAVEAMVAEFEERWQPAWTARLDSVGLTRHEAVTLASIVEKEARVGEERPTIAAVYLNRLERGMPLQADPTVQYARGEHTARVLYRDLEIDSPYNTYRHPGLPPGPIASPGSASLEAALHPADVPFLYFVARPDGRHEFRTTFQEHVRIARELRRARDAQSRAADAAP